MFIFTFYLLLFTLNSCELVVLEFYDDLPQLRIQSMIDIYKFNFTQYFLVFSIFGFLFLKLVLVISANDRSVLWLVFLLFIPIISDLIYILFGLYGEKRLLLLFWFMLNVLLFVSGLIPFK